jgi:hypothetical protein
LRGVPLEPWIYGCGSAVASAANRASVGFDDVKIVAIVNQSLHLHVRARRGRQHLRSRCHAAVVNSLNEVVRTIEQIDGRDAGCIVAQEWRRHVLG